MPDTYVKGSIAGKLETRQFDLRVVSRSAQVGLPQSAIDALGLPQVPGFPHDPSPDNGANRAPAYLARVDFEERRIHQHVTPAAEPTIGADALRALGYQVDLDRGRIIKPTEPLKIYRGLMPTMLDVSDLRPTS